MRRGDQNHFSFFAMILFNLTPLANLQAFGRTAGSNIAQSIDKNFAGLLVVWDRMFGTYEEENETGR